MTRVSDVYSVLNELAPFATQCEWDNSGLLVGDAQAAVKKIGFCLDLTAQTLDEAVKNGVDLIVTHHPVIFHAQKSFLRHNPAYEAVRAGISVVSAHTCFDVADGGVNDVLAATIGLRDIHRISGDGEAASILRFGKVDNLSPKELSKLASYKLNCGVSLTDACKAVNTVAVCGGAGGSFIKEAFAFGADALITGEAKHNELLEAKNIGLTLIVAGHFETESLAMPFLADKIAHEIEAVECVALPQNRPAEYICC